MRSLLVSVAHAYACQVQRAWFIIRDFSWFLPGSTFGKKKSIRLPWIRCWNNYGPLTRILVKVCTRIGVKVDVFTYRFGCFLTSLCSAFVQGIIWHSTCTRNKRSPHVCLKVYKEMQKGKRKRKRLSCWICLFSCSLLKSTTNKLPLHGGLDASI